MTSQEAIPETTPSAPPGLPGAGYPASFRAEVLANALLDAIPAHVAVLDGQGRIVAVNAAWREFWRNHQPATGMADARCGLAADYLDISRSSQGADREFALAAAEGIESVLAGKRGVFTLEYPCLAGGASFWFRMEASRLGENGHGCLVAHWDITHDRLREEALRKSEECYRAVVEDQTDAISRFRDGRYTFVNEVYCRIFGRSAEQLLGHSWHPVAHPDDVPRVEAALRQLAPENPVITMENRVFAANGAVRWMQFVNRGFFDADGRLREIQSVGRDVTDRKQAEAALRASELSYQTMVDALSEGVLVYGLDGRIRVSNPAAARILGLSREQMQGAGQSGPGWQAFDERMCPLEVEALPVSRTFRFGTPVHGEIIALQRPDASLIWLSINSAPIREAEEGRLTGVVVTLDDISERKRSEAAMSALRGDMQELLEWQVAGQTAASIAHELNQPLNAITTYGEAALMRMEALAPAPEKLVRAVGGMVEQAERAGRIVRELLGFFHKADIAPETFDLGELVRETVALALSSALDPTEVRVARVPGLRPVLANRLHIGKVCLNLLHNGMQAMAEAGVAGPGAGMDIVFSDDVDCARVCLSNPGQALDAAAVQRMFDPFYSTKPGGIGMGLTISRSLVEAHGGKLWYEPARERGAMFCFTLPFAP